jgi:hypothetical protein
MAIKFSTAPEMEWLFVPDSIGSESMSRTHVVWPDNQIPVTLDMVAERRSLSEVEVSRSYDLQAFCAVVISCKLFAQ